MSSRSVLPLLLLALVAPSAAQPLEPFAARYQGQKRLGPFTAKALATVELKSFGTHLHYAVSTLVKLSVLERKFEDCSVMRVVGDRLYPLEYAHIDQSDPKNNLHTAFDWSASSAVTRFGTGQSLSAAISWPTWDPMSFQVALAATRHARRESKKEIQTVIERGTVKSHRVLFEGPSPPPFAGAPQVFAVRSEKPGGGTTALLLDSLRPFRPIRISVDDIHLDHLEDLPPAGIDTAAPMPRCPVGVPP